MQDNGLEKPSDSFSHSLMDALLVVSAEDLRKENALQSLMKTGGMEAASANFTTSVMAAVRAKQAAQHQPVIGRFGWIGIAASFAAIILYALSWEPDAVATTRLNVVGGIQVFSETISHALTTVTRATTAIVCMISLLLVLLVEQTLRKRVL